MPAVVRSEVGSVSARLEEEEAKVCRIGVLGEAKKCHGPHHRDQTVKFLELIGRFGVVSCWFTLSMDGDENLSQIASVQRSSVSEPVTGTRTEAAFGCKLQERAPSLLLLGGSRYTVRGWFFRGRLELPWVGIDRARRRFIDSFRK